MFKSSGYFKGINCPYYQSGLCQRAHCHFRHVKDETCNGDRAYNRSTSLDSASVSTGNSSLLPKPDYPPLAQSRSIGSKLAELEESIEKEKEILEIKSTSPVAARESDLKGKAQRTRSKHSEYAVESPKFSSATKEGSKNKVRSSSNGLQYKPTPKAELKKLKEPSDKYSLDNISTSCSELEYDPLTNFSTQKANYSDVVVKRKSDEEEDSGLPAKKTKVTFLIEGDQPDDDGDNDDNDLDDSASEESVDPCAKFSDDNSDVDDITKEEEQNNEKTVVPTEYCENKETPSDKLSPWPGLIYNLNSSELPDIFFNSNEKEKDIFNDITSAYSSNKNNNNKKTESSAQNNSSVDAVKSNSSVSKERTHHKDKKHSENSSKSKANGKHSSSSSETKSDKSQKTHGCSSSSDRKERHSSSDHSKKDKHSSSDRNDRHSSSEHSKKERHSSSEHLKRERNSSSDHSRKDKHSSSSVSKSNKSVSSEKSVLPGETKNKDNRSSSREKSHKDKNSHSKSEKQSSSSSHNSNSRSNSSSSNTHSSQSHHKNAPKSHDKNNKHKEPSQKVKDTDPNKLTPRKRNNSTGKDKIISLNVDLFGVDSDTENAAKDEKLQELSDLSDEDCENNIDSMYYDKFLDNDDFAEEDTYDECLKIFEEGAKTKPQLSYHDKRKKDDSAVSSSSNSKQRVAHNGSSEISRDPEKKPASRLTPAQVMHNRFVEMQERALAAVQSRRSSKDLENKPGTSLLSAKNRVAHTPKEDKKKKSKTGGKTTVGTSKTDGRQSQKVSSSRIKRPTIPAEFGSKVATNIRQRYLNVIIDECLKIFCDEEIAYGQALDEEMAVYKKSANKSVYLNVAVNAIKRLRVRSASNSSKKNAAIKSPTKLSHETVLGGAKAFNTSYTLHRSGGGGANKVVKELENFTGADLYKRLSAYLLTEEQLRENGFPRPDTYIAGKAVLYREEFNKQTEVRLKNHEKICSRCGKRFTVYPNGHYQIEEECVYHWGKCWKKRIAGSLESRYTCCSADVGAEGCQVGRVHVHETNRYEDMTGYMKTMPSSPPIDGDYGVCAMDCEMIYTSKGSELARVTVIGSDLKPIYEAMVKPERDVVDYNTRFSGITEDDLKDVTTTITEVQAVLMNLFMEKTIVIGHSLESDLIALKMIHSTVVDTSVVFPHKMGPPFKRALKNLMSEYLMKIIQDDVGGHDSQEDAVSCMQLMQYKLKEEYKKEIRKT